ncbi:MAG: InlB B-repeat-containing protein, partial [Bacteroidales bacterium]|nr:InlB B-repeat-containing protein [Bacteroidales bacterium]
QFNTANVTTMAAMFNNCSSLESITFGNNFTTAEVTSMSNMFNTCQKLKNLDLSKFNTAKVTTMESMFAMCTSLEYLDLSSFNTDEVTNMSAMFSMKTAEPGNLQVLDLSNFTTTKVANMRTMFYECRNLTTILCDNDWIISITDANKQNYQNIFWFSTTGRAQILGNEKTKYSIGQISKTDYAKVDKIKTASTPGYFTTGKYKIFYELNGGTEKTNPAEFDENSAELTINNPEKEGYTFVGWSGTPITGLSGNENKDVSIPAGSRGNRIYTANWQINQYTIQFETDGGSEIASITKNYGAALTEPTTTKEGYDFAGWNIPFPSTMPATDLVLTAQWTPKKYTLTFDTDGGNDFLATTLKDYGADLSYISALSDPTKLGYDFVKWDKVIPTTMPATDLTITALWTPTVYNINLNYDGGELPTGKSNPTTFTIETETFTLEKPEKTGYTFAGWHTGKTVDPDGTITKGYYAQDLDYTATWNVNQYTITFNTDGGSAVAAITQDYNSAITAPANPTKEHYKFIGWDKAIPATMPAENISLTAQWEAIEYNITLDYAGGELPTGKSNPSTYTIETPTFTLEKPIRTGYTFAGWNTGKTVDPDGTIVTGSFDDIALTATWQINQYTITFDTDGADPIEAITQYYNTAITAPASPVKKGFTFLGWQPALPATMPAQDLTVKAQWRDDRETIAVDFNGTTSFPTDADKFCNGNENSISLPFTITKGQPSEYIVTFENGTVVNGKVDANNNVLIEIPNDLESGVYKGSVVFNGDPGLYKESDAYPVAITANIPKNAALQIYSDVLLVDNHDNNYSAYQWYKDGNAISGATLQFYSEPSFSGRYTVKITDKDGKEFMSCPIKTGVSVKNTKSSVKVYPNPATSGEQFTLEIEEYDPAKDYTIMIFTANGTLVKKLSGLEKINTTTLPSGIYSGSLISNGEKSGFKVIVK